MTVSGTCTRQKCRQNLVPLEGLSTGTNTFTSSLGTFSPWVGIEKQSGIKFLETISGKIQQCLALVRAQKSESCRTRTVIRGNESRGRTCCDKSWMEL